VVPLQQLFNYFWSTEIMPPSITLSSDLILTMDDAHPFYQNGSIGISGSLIETMGAEKTTPGRDSLNFPGCVIIPGLVNAHTHLFIGMWRGLNDDRTLFPWLDVLSPAIGRMNVEDMIQSTQLGCFEALRSGTTTIVECCRTDPGITAQAASELGLRSLSGGMPASEWFGSPMDDVLPLLAENTRKLLSRREQYRGLAGAFLGAHSPYNCSVGFLIEARRLADEMQIPFNIHLSECQAEMDIIRQRYGKSPVQHLADIGVLGPGLIADHCVWFDDRDIEIFVASRGGIVHNPISNAKLGSGVAPIKRYLDAGIPVALGTDSVVSNNSLNMFEEMKFAMLQQRIAAGYDDRPQPTELDALKMATINGARVLNMQDRIGSLEVGKHADLLVLELPPEAPATVDAALSHLVYSAGPEHLRAVMVDGKFVVCDGELQNVNSSELKTNLRAYFNRRREELA
jgi:5-methylthioadenosine/S-adenosylhomocysteine deaminase